MLRQLPSDVWTIRPLTGLKKFEDIFSGGGWAWAEQPRHEIRKLATHAIKGIMGDTETCQKSTN